MGKRIHAPNCGIYPPVGGFPRFEWNGTCTCRPKPPAPPATRGEAPPDRDATCAWDCTLPYPHKGPCGRAPEPTPPPASADLVARPDDFDWALHRVQSMRDIAEKNASVYGPTLLKGHGYPDEVFSWAQDAWALSIVLAALTAPARPDERG